MHSNKLWNFKGVTISLQKLTQWLGQCGHVTDPEVTDIVYIIIAKLHAQNRERATAKNHL